MAKWAVELGEHDINYRPRTSITGQILADFIAEKPEEEPPASSIPAEEETLEPLTLFTDGSSCLEGSEAGLILKILEGVEFTYALRFEFEASNNEADGVPHLTVGSHPSIYFHFYNIMVMEIDTTPSSPTLMTSASVILDEEERGVDRKPLLTTPINPT
ncbi:hypothetical protein Tco_1359850 [Tanacetum coccineum]